ncbi:hypothetical protein M409DRAFT_25033 [Zasmidium cellare ATCC 36951]|uniref:DnaJ homologue subfamily C member 28 conserved domain-containing protein n=1 Tax=Zasmidium cellare ATCC 36951 TaxID=1080233 RepID=A0A6A6CEP5_ZASCE|nr:uncharacterized protein M409DRAFT_25033 [Zasmidium cellare ATCC 36951]KAF2164638.1 hypothetical protein M409DRAFT_25033 [Zasmidium cellare ATCC 36951]
MSEESLETGGRSARKAVEEAGFSEDLKRELEKKVADASFRSDNASAFAQVSMPASAGKGTRETAAARPWTGNESIEDASLRMLNDSHKPLRVAAKVPSVRGPSRVDTGRPKSKPGTGVRLANARDRSSVYSYANEQEGLTDEEREKFRREMKARFQPGARAVPATIQGLSSLANERIEDAIARGQFKNLPDRGKKLERDYNANSPFIDTTEYFMNKIIKKQEITPPWIEKQQEVISTANTFRRRLRADWKRHVSRMIASRGGSLKSQMKLAEEYAFAESFENPQKQLETINRVDDKGHMSQITISGEFRPPPADNTAVIEEEINVTEQTFNDDGSLEPHQEEEVKASNEQRSFTQAPPPQPPRRPTVRPFRDPQWEATERSYHDLAIKNLNSITRSYNLMAPDLAKKPYYILSRELRSCFADVAPEVAHAIREKALAPKFKGVEVIGHTPGGVLEKFSMDKASHVYDERKPQYGFKEFWRDLFAPKS